VKEEIGYGSGARIVNLSFENQEEIGKFKSGSSLYLVKEFHPSHE